jgi:cytochrome c peroxidase
MKRRSVIAVLLLTVIGASVAITACRKSDSRRHRTTMLNFKVPDGFPEPTYNFTNNPITAEGFALGRKLFHDHRLSSHLDVTCASCHQQHAAYTTFDHDLGHGTNHQHTRRNVPGIFNMAWQKEFEWDGRIKSLDEQPMACMTAPEKMGEAVNNVIDKISVDSLYPGMFAEAFGDARVTGDRISKALVQFVLMIVSANSKYDSVRNGTATFNASQQAGYELFKSKCASCHAEPLFTDLTYRNNGIGSNPFHTDYGRMEVTGDPADSLKFKVPSLRNIALTGYFAHDGRYISVGQLLDFYSSPIPPQPTLDPSLRNGIPMTPLEKFYIEEFLFTLSDSTLVSDPDFE